MCMKSMISLKKLKMPGKRWHNFKAAINYLSLLAETFLIVKLTLIKTHIKRTIKTLILSVLLMSGPLGAVDLFQNNSSESYEVVNTYIIWTRSNESNWRSTDVDSHPDNTEITFYRNESSHTQVYIASIGRS